MARIFTPIQMTHRRRPCIGPLGSILQEQANTIHIRIFGIDRFLYCSVQSRIRRRQCRIHRSIGVCAHPGSHGSQSSITVPIPISGSFRRDIDRMISWRQSLFYSPRYIDVHHAPASSSDTIIGLRHNSTTTDRNTPRGSIGRPTAIGVNIHQSIYVNGSCHCFQRSHIHFISFKRGRNAHHYSMVWIVIIVNDHMAIFRHSTNISIVVIVRIRIQTDLSRIVNG